MKRMNVNQMHSISGSGDNPYLPKTPATACTDSIDTRIINKGGIQINGAYHKDNVSIGDHAADNIHDPDHINFSINIEDKF